MLGQRDYKFKHSGVVGVITGCLRHLTGSLLLLTSLLLRLAFRLNLADIRCLNLLVPVAGAFALSLVSGDMAALHGVLLSVCVVFSHDSALFCARSVWRSSPWWSALSALSRPFSLAQRHRHVMYKYYIIVV